MEFNHRITQINKVNEKNTVLSFFIHERLFQYPSSYLTDKWLDYNKWCEINSKIEQLDQNELKNALKENIPLFHHIPESHIVLKITSKKVTSKLIEAVQLILNNEHIEFNCYLEVDIRYDPDYSVLSKCDSGLSFEERPIEIDRIGSYSPTQQQHDKYTPTSIETNGGTSMEISPVYISNQIQKSVEEYVPEGTNSNSVVYTPSKVSNKKHDGYNPVSPASTMKENNNDPIVYIPGKPNVTKRKKSPSRDLITEKRNTRSASQSPVKKLITKLPAETITKSPTLSSKPSTSKRSSTKDKDCDFVEPLEKKAKSKSTEKKSSIEKFSTLFGTDSFESSQDSDCKGAEISIQFFENEELLSQTSQNSRSSNSPDMFNDSDIAPSQENDESLLESRMKEINERYPPDLLLDTSSTKKSSTRARSSRKDRKKDEYFSEKKGISSFLNKKPDDSKEIVLNGWLSTKSIEQETSKKKREEEPSKKVKIKGPTKAERNEMERQRSKLLEKNTKEVEKLKELGNEMLALGEKDEQKVEALSFNDISVDTFHSYIHKKKKYFNRIFAEYCQQKTHKVNHHKVNFMIIPKLMDEAKHMAIIQEFSNIYKKDDDDDLPVLDKYTDLYFEQMMPELILLMTIKHHDMSREDAISRINKQSQLFPAELENTFY